MAWFGKNRGTDDEAGRAMAQYRQNAWAYALAHKQLPDFVEARLKDAAAAKIPWMSTMQPAELLLAKSHGIRPLATVTGTCWFHYGYSWTDGHVDGWGAAVDRLKREALAVGANAVVDVQMRTVQSKDGRSMDFTLFGTAVKVDGLPPSRDPVIATISALEFVRLLEMGIVVCGISVGTDYNFLDFASGYGNGFGGGSTGGIFGSGPAYQVQQQLRAFGGNVPITELTKFWESIRRKAHAQLRANAKRIGNGVLARTHFGELLRVERDKQPPDYLGRHIVIGTVIETRRGDGIPHHIATVIDMRDELSPLNGGSTGSRNTLDSNNEYSGGI